jgi:putative peptide zinc metalloprotease protein
VGRPDTGVFVALPPEGVAVLGWLGAGLSVAETRRRFTQRYGEPPDLETFLAGMADCGFVRDLDGRPGAGAEEPRPRGVALLADVPQHRVAWLLSRPLRLLYAVVWVTVPMLLVAVPAVRPVPSDGVLVSRPLVNAVLVAVIAWTLVLLHEAAHAITVRALGCVGRLSVSRRLWFLVGQTELTGIRALPRERRYAPYLAGMTWDLTLLLGCLGLQSAGYGGAVVRVVAYTLTLALLFQFAVFMRTDLYFVLANRLRLGDLMGDTRRWLGNLSRRLVRRRPAHDLTGLPHRELRIIRWYAPFYVLGSVVVTLALALLTVPVMDWMVRAAVRGLADGPAAASFWDGLGFLLLLVAQIGTFAWVVIAERRGRAGA